MERSTALQVAIDCRISDPQSGVGRAVMALAGALSATTTREQRYTLVVRQDVSDWIKPHIFGPCRLETVSTSVPIGTRVKNKLRTLPGVQALWKRVHPYSKRSVSVPVSDGLLESRGFDIVHFPTQAGLLTNIPSIYQPWDLQHLHYPQYFSEMEFKARETCYRAFCSQAKYVCVQTHWGKSDLTTNFGLDPDKVKVIRWGSNFERQARPSTSAIAATIAKFKLPEQFLFYPAVTWEHKNHAVIIRALRHLKDIQGLSAHVCFSGKATPYRRNLERLASELGVADQIRYLGFLSAEELQAVYACATALVVASKFEGFGLPLLEAFQAHLPVLSSNATVLPEVAREGALYFDPDSPRELSQLMYQVLGDVRLRAHLIERGDDVLSRYSIKQTAADFQNLYELTASGDRRLTAAQ